MKEFHILKRARDILKLESSFFSFSGNVIFASLDAARKFTHEYNQRTKKRINTGDVFTAGIIDEILHHICFLYRKDVKETIFEELLHHLFEKIGPKNVEDTLRMFVEEFPPPHVYSGVLSKDEYLGTGENWTRKRAEILEELLVVWLGNMNPAFSFLKEIITDESLRRKTSYLDVVKEMRSFFDTQKPFGPYNQSLFEMLRSPSVHEPYSLAGQLRYILENWGFLLENLVLKIKKGMDVIKEEKVFFFLGQKSHEVYTYEETEEPFELTQDADWMKNLVLIAKHTHVWLYQLSRKYGRRIDRIDEIPDEELEELKKWGITGLWLIGLWERSPASKRIKNLCGNRDAIASAYSIYDYKIAEDLGGERACEALRIRAQSFGIKLGCDMVPNHMGIYSKWLIEKPEWFIYRKDNPYPWYSFSYENLSLDDNLEIYIEDHYYDRTDAAVVCKRVDKVNGETFYIYHGNDGTGMPWNDTVQLNYLLPEVREAMIKIIIEVAKKFPVIRFDAAMTLTKMHYQRLWFPEPGKGGAIPTRAEFSMTKEEFEKHMPKEFWREVVDRVKTEAPDTLLIAEAFWLLEGYFVRNLGMHRVYNSAFMNMMRDEENEKYRKIIKNTLETDPEILKRFVNFLSNPDEKTAYEQFGDGDKYFGVCTMMVSMPGLPMFSHGQIEGLKEKYGMEFKRPYLNEEVNQDLIRRHEKEIFPLTQKRYLFSEVENFFLYDFIKEDGTVDEDVFAFSNCYKEEKGLVVYHNRNKKTEGWIKMSTPKNHKTRSVKLRNTLCQALRLSAEKGFYVIFKDVRTGLEYISESSELAQKGFYLRLGPYQSVVFMDIREISEEGEKALKIIADGTKGEGIVSVEAACRFVKGLFALFDWESQGDILEIISDRDLKSRFITERTELFLGAYSGFLQIEGETGGPADAVNYYRETLESVVKMGSYSSRELADAVPFLSDILRNSNRDNRSGFLELLLLWQTVLSFLNKGRRSGIGRSLLSAAVKKKCDSKGIHIYDPDRLIEEMLLNSCLLTSM